jgi:hypothetical protein
MSNTAIIARPIVNEYGSMHYSAPSGSSFHFTHPCSIQNLRINCHATNTTLHKVGVHTIDQLERFLASGKKLPGIGAKRMDALKNIFANPNEYNRYDLEVWRRWKKSKKTDADLQRMLDGGCSFGSRERCPESGGLNFVLLKNGGLALRCFYHEEGLRLHYPAANGFEIHEDWRTKESAKQPIWGRHVVLSAS